MTLPPLTRLRQIDTHRLLLSVYSDPDGRPSPLARLVKQQEHLQALRELAAATDETRWAERNLLPGIGRDELVFHIPYARLINNAFIHARPEGGRFNSADRGAWYAGFDIETSKAEVIFHKTQEYAEIGRFDDVVDYDDCLADFAGEYHDLRSISEFNACLDPNSYAVSQQLAAQLLEAAGLGLVYPSVRHVGGTCISCFRPPAVHNVRLGERYRFVWKKKPTPVVELVKAA